MTTARATGPFVDLDPFQAEDRAYFKGRDAEQRVVIANLRTAALTILYGAAGVGKSSLLLAGVVPALRETRPHTPLVVFRDWVSAGHERRLAQACVDETERLGFHPRPGAAGLPLDELLAECARAAGTTVLVLLDQFEDYLQYHPASEATEAFEAQFARAVNRDDVDVGFLIAVREASLPRLDRFRARIPQLLGNALRLEHLDHDSAFAAIGPPVIEQWNRDHPDEPPMGIETELVEEVIREAQADPARGEHGGQGQARAEAVIEAPFLQLVMARLWKHERQLGSRVLRLATLKQGLGGARQIVRSHLDDVMRTLGDRQRAVCATFFDRFVTPSGDKVPCNLRDLHEWAGPLAAEVERTLKALSDGRILRTVPPDPRTPDQERYEVFHDVFAPSILDWHRAFQAGRARAQAVADTRVRARLKWLPWLGLATSLALAGLGFSLLYSVESGASRRAVESMLAGPADPELALERALDAAERIGRVRWLQPPGAEIEDALRLAVQATRQEWSRRLPYKVMGVAVSADGQRLVTRDVDDRRGHLNSRLTVWTLGPEGPVKLASREFADPTLNGRVRFLPAGDAVVAVIGPSARVWKYLDPKAEPLELAQGQTIGTALAVHDRLALVATAGSEVKSGQRKGSIKVWRLDDAGTPALQHEIDTGSAWLMGLAFDPEGRFVAGSAVDRDDAQTGYTSVWHLGSGRRVLDLPMNAGSDAVAFAPDGTSIALAGRDNELRVLQPVGQTLDQRLAKAAAAPAALQADPDAWHVRILAGHLERVRDLAYSSDSQHIASAGADRSAIVWDARTGEKLQVLTGHQNWVESVAFTPDGGQLASVGRDRTLRLWNSAGHGAGVHAIAFNPDPARRQFATGSGDRSAKLWDHSALVPRLQHTLVGHSDTVYRVAFDARGERVATASFDKTARVWDTRSGALLGTFSGHEDQLRDVAFSTDGQWLITSSADGTVRMNALADPRAAPLRLVHHEGATTQVAAIAIDRTQPRWLSAGWDGVIRLWDDQGKALGTIPRSQAYADGARIVDAAFIAPRREVAVLIGHSVYLWPVTRFERDDGTPPRRLRVEGPRLGCDAMAVDAGGTRLAVACDDAAVHVYDLRPAEPVLWKSVRVHRDWVMGAAFSADGSLLGSASLDRSFQVAPLEFDALRALALKRQAAFERAD